MILIGLAGPIEVGKSTMARELRKKFKNDEIDPTIISFGNHLKESARFLFNLKHEQVYTSSGKSEPIEWLNNITPREILQKMGTEFVRDMIHPDFWVKWVEHEIEEIDSVINNHIVLIDDCRFANELQMIRKYNGYVFHLTRTYAQSTTHTAHRSEETFHYEHGDYVIHLPNDIDAASDILFNIITTICIDI